MPFKINDIFTNKTQLVCNITNNEVLINYCTNVNLKNKNITLLY